MFAIKCCIVEFSIKKHVAGEGPPLLFSVMLFMFFFLDFVKVLNVLFIYLSSDMPLHLLHN